MAKRKDNKPKTSEPVIKKTVFSEPDTVRPKTRATTTTSKGAAKTIAAADRAGAGAPRRTASLAKAAKAPTAAGTGKKAAAPKPAARKTAAPEPEPKAPLASKTSVRSAAASPAPKSTRPTGTTGFAAPTGDKKPPAGKPSAKKPGAAAKTADEKKAPAAKQPPTAKAPARAKAPSGKKAAAKKTPAAKTGPKAAPARTRARKPAGAVPAPRATSSYAAPSPAPPAPALVAPPPPLPYPPMFQREIPAEYGETKIVALVRDPEWIFLYWEVAPAIRERLSIPRGAHSRPMGLRIYDVTGVHFDGINAHSFYDVEINDLASSWYLRIPESDRAYVVDLGTYDPEGSFQIIARSNAVSVPPAGMSGATGEEWMNVTEEQFAEIYRMSGGLRLREQHGSAEFGRPQPEQMLAELRRQWVGSGMWSGASGAVQAPPEKRKGFWLQVDCDVIVYGMTEPGAKVTLQGRPVQLSPDGRFHARFAFPDGRIDLPIQAVSEDGEDTREITPVVTRKTR